MQRLGVMRITENQEVDGDGIIAALGTVNAYRVGGRTKR
jgi:hypothetical protein